MKNMGAADRNIRVVAALIVGIFFFVEVIIGTIAIVLLIFAGILLLTSLVSTCPLYLPFVFKTFKSKSTE